MPVFPPFYVPHRTQEILKRSYLSQGVVFWSKIRYGGSKRQSEYSRWEYVALPVVSGTCMNSHLRYRDIMLPYRTFVHLCYGPV